MDNVLVLHCHSDKRMADQLPTWDYLSTIDTRYTVYHYLCQQPYDYADAVRAHWDGDHTLVNVEQDMEPDAGMLESLLECPDPMCGQAYWLSCLSTGRREPLYCAFLGNNFMPLRYGDPHADAMGLGLIKLTAEARRRLGPPDRVLWNQLDYEILRHVRASGSLWHVHWPACLHHHGFMDGENAKIKTHRQRASTAVDDRPDGKGG